MLKQIKTFFHFHKRERNGVLLLTGLIIIVLLIYQLIPYLVKPEFDRDSFLKFIQLEKTLNDSVLSNQTFNTDEKYASNEIASLTHQPKQKTIFKPIYFNPNIVTESELDNMGFNKRFIKSFLNYRGKGKVFKNEQDFKTVFGLTEDEFKIAQPFLTFPTQNNALENEKKKEIEKRKEQLIIDINTADSTELTNLKGIGPVFARRIINYRNKLGGFYQKEQLREVWGIDSILFNRIEPFVVLGNAIKLIDINTVSFEQLKTHPYLTYNLANSIIQIRNRTGRFKKIEDIKKSVLLKPEIFEKIKPYLTVSNE